MSYQAANPLSSDFEVDVSGEWSAYWLALLRVITGWWFFHAGVTKLITDGLSYGYAPIYLKGMEGTVLGPLATFMGGPLGPLMEALVPLLETFVGLALILGVAVRLSSFVGASFMTFFWVGNAEFAHGVVNGNLLGLLLFVTMIVLATGRYYGLDAIIEEMDVVDQYPRLKYLLG